MFWPNGKKIKMSMRLNKFLSSCGIASRRKCDEIILSGAVSVNGKVIKELGVSINEKKDKVFYEGKELFLPSSFVYIKLNKPKGYACTAKDEKGRKTIYDLVKTDERLFSIGRLDYDTEGLIILTNDGDFANKVAHPKYAIDKEYHVTIEGNIKESELAVLRKGVVIDGERMPSAKVEFLSSDDKFTKLSVVINEGMNRQVRRMCKAINKSVIGLHRAAIGNITVKNLKLGEYRSLNNKEIEDLLK